MRPSPNIGPNVPAFLRKLWKIVNDPTIDDLVCWSSDGESFVIKNPAEFCYNLLPIYYKHNNMSSFIRQLNMYGFHKLANENGCDKDEIRFFHPFFQQSESRLLQHIKRKIGSTKPEERKVPLDQIGKVLSDVKHLKGRQETVDTQLATMKQENAALWRELALLRQKHMKQQQIVNKLIQYITFNAYTDVQSRSDAPLKTLIHFLVSIVQQPSRTTIGVKRRFPLMINDGPDTKSIKMNTPSTDGATIHEIDPEAALPEEILDIPTVTSPITETSELPDMLDNFLEVTDENEPTVEDLLEDSEDMDLNLDINNAELLNMSPTINNSVTNLETPDIMLSPDGKSLLKKNQFPIPKNKQPASNTTKTPKPKLTTPTNIESSRINLNTIDPDNILSTDSNLNTDAEILEINSDMFQPQVTTNDQNIKIEPELSVASPSGDMKQPDVGTSCTTPKINMAVATRLNNDFNKMINTSDFNIHVNSTQGELETIKDMLFENGLTLDANTFLDLFNPNEALSLDVPQLSLNEETEWPSSSTNDQLFSGSELISYNPNDLLNFDNLLEETEEEK